MDIQWSTVVPRCVICLAACLASCASTVTDEYPNPDRDPTVGAINEALSWYRAHGPLSLHSRPQNPDGRTTVKYIVDLVQLIGLDVKSQTLTGKFWENYAWYDSRIGWNPDDYGNITHIQIPHGETIWRPDILLYNELKHSRPTDSYYDTISYEGDVTWVPATIYTVPCNMDITQFPFDFHTCTLTFGSWKLSVKELDLFLYTDITRGRPDLVDNSEWGIVGQEIRLRTFQYPVGNWTLIDYEMTFRRRAGFFAYVLVFPSILMTFLTMILFLLPPECEDKVNLGMSLFISYFVLLMIVVESTPKSGLTIPVIGKYLFISLGMIATSIFICTLLFNLSRKDRLHAKEPFKPRTMKLLHCLEKVLCLKRSRNQKRADSCSSNADKITSNNLHGGSFKVLPSGERVEREPDDDHVSHHDVIPNSQWGLLAEIMQRLILISYMAINMTVLCVLFLSFLHTQPPKYGTDI